MTKGFYYRGHHYKVVPIENSEDFTIVKDGKFVRRVSNEIAARRWSMLTSYLTDMDYKKYSEELETIIAAIDMHEHQRILVNALMKAAKERSEK